MAKWWNKTVTVYHMNSTGQWLRAEYDNCFYGNEKRRTVDGLTVRTLSSPVVRIPSIYAPLCVGDIVVNGIVDDVIPDGDSGNTLKKKYAGSCFTVGVVRVNTDVLPHVLGGVEN